MNLRDALKLKPGDEIMFGDSMWSAKVDAAGTWRHGHVVHVTPRGGVHVRVGEHLEWIPYNWIYGKDV